MVLGKLYALYNALVRPGGLQNLPLGKENIESLYAFLKGLFTSLEEVFKFVSENSERNTQTGQDEIKEDKVEEFRELMAKEIEFKERLTLKLTGTKAEDVIKLADIEALLMLDLVDLQ